MIGALTATILVAILVAWHASTSVAVAIAVADEDSIENDGGITDVNNEMVKMTTSIPLFICPSR